MEKLIKGLAEVQIDDICPEEKIAGEGSPHKTNRLCCALI